MFILGISIPGLSTCVQVSILQNMVSTFSREPTRSATRLADGLDKDGETR
jgi:hypothetical protein